jgi:ATP-binding cassette subfamily A (ABC1) protein 1
MILTCTSTSASILAAAEGSNVGITTANINEGAMSFGDVLIFLLFDFLLYGFLAFYFEQVLPTEYGTQRPFYFLCTRDFWLGTPADSYSSLEDAKANTEAALGGGEGGEASFFEGSDEAVRQAGEGGIRIQQLGKVYSNGKRAVSNLDLEMHQGQITSLLGHNGAGKSTTIGMLTGLFPATHGDAIVHGQSMRTQMKLIRTYMGVCPQHSVLYAEMTVVEHLQLFAILKGVPTERQPAEIERLVQLVGLTEKRLVRSAALSGGMKRKLSVAIAMCGASTVIYLDEPTSGMDPYSRRMTWQLLKECKYITPEQLGKGSDGTRVARTIVLTTHFMDEADLLGDRIAIMAGGKLQAAGSSLFLKRRFGLGYQLTIVRTLREGGDQADEGADELKQLVTQHVDNAVCLSDVASEVAFQLPLESVDRFAQLFTQLETKKELNIATFGISMTTLEEVFLKLADIAHEHELEEQQKNDSDEGSRHHSVASMASQHSIPIAEEDQHQHVSATGEGVIESQLPAELTPANAAVQLREMMVKRWHCTRRDIRSFLFEIMVPVLMVALVLLVMTVDVTETGPMLLLTPLSLYGSGAEVVLGGGDYTNTRSLQDVQDDGLAPVCFSSGQLDSACVQGAGTNTSTASAFLVSTDLLDEYERHDGVRFGALLSPASFQFKASISNVAASGEVELDTIANDIQNADMVMFNSSSSHSVAAFFAQRQTLRLESLLSKPGEVEWKVSSHPLPRSNRESAQLQVALQVVAALLVLFPFTFITANYVGFLVKERSCKSKHLQLVSGVHPLVYWLSNYLWDLCQYTLVVVIVMLVFFAYGNELFVGSTETSAATFLNFWLYGLSVLPLCYCYSFAFDNHSNAQVVIAALNFLAGFIFVVTHYILSNIESTKAAATGLLPFFQLFPPFNFGQGIVNLATNGVQDQLAQIAPGLMPPAKSPFEVLEQGFMFMIIEAVVFFTLTMVLEVGWDRALRFVMQLQRRMCGHHQAAAGANNDTVEMRKMSNPLAKPLTDEGEVADSKLQRQNSLSGLQTRFADDNTASPDAEAEKERVLGAEGGGDWMVKVVGLNKKYAGRGGAPAKHAVRDLHLAIPEGQCFGFLGVNGAGKTTTMSMLTGDETPSGGDAWLNGSSVLHELHKVRQYVGYCPQFDPLLDKMTATETLYMFGRLKGVPSALLGPLVKELITRVGLDDFADKLAGGYSGGNKRKLSLAVALLGRPKVVFLDEPSTGMDPVARRKMWAVISGAKRGKSVLLTSHYMEECEALCSRIGILVGGRFKVLGSAQELKDKYGSGYHVEINASSTTVGDVKAFMQQHFIGSHLEEDHVTRLKYLLPPQNLKLSQIFQLMENDRHALGITDYSVSQSTLEQIFISIAKQQEQETGPVAGMSPDVAEEEMAGSTTRSTTIREI